MGRLTVIQLLPALESGGVERSTIEIADALVRDGHRALVVSAGGRLLPRLLAAGAEHIELAVGRKSPRAFWHVAALRRLFAGADIVHARSRMPAWLAWRALRGMRPSRPAFVTTVHGLNTPSGYSAVMTRGDRVVCVSDTVRAHLLAHYPGLDPACLRVIPRGIDPVAFPRVPGLDHAARHALALAHPALGGHGPLLLLPGRGTRLKGHADGLRLLATLHAGGVDARLWMPGVVQATRGRYLEELRRLSQALGVADAVALTEATDGIADAYAASDLVLQLSRKPEAFGRTVVEALSVGRPVLGWAHGGVGELLARLQPAGAVPAFDEERLADRALALLASPPDPPGAMPYTLQAMQDATLALYRSLVAP